MGEKKDFAEKVEEVKKEIEDEASKIADAAHQTIDDIKGKFSPMVYFKPFFSLDALGHKKEEKLRYDYSPLEYFYPPKDEADLTHKYSIIRRTILGEDTTKPSKDFKSLAEYVNCARKSISDTRESFQKGTGLNIRYYLTPVISLLPLLIFSRRRPRKIFYTYAFTSWLICPEPWRAFYNAK